MFWSKPRHPTPSKSALKEHGLQPCRLWWTYGANENRVATQECGSGRQPWETQVSARTSGGGRKRPERDRSETLTASLSGFGSPSVNVRAVTWNCDRTHKKIAHLKLLLPCKKNLDGRTFRLHRLAGVQLKDGPMFSEITKAMFD